MHCVCRAGFPFYYAPSGGSVPLSHRTFLSNAFHLQTVFICKRCPPGNGVHLYTVALRLFPLFPFCAPRTDITRNHSKSQKYTNMHISIDSSKKISPRDFDMHWHYGKLTNHSTHYKMGGKRMDDSLERPSSTQYERSVHSVKAPRNTRGEILKDIGEKLKSLFQHTGDETQLFTTDTGHTVYGPVLNSAYNKKSVQNRTDTMRMTQLEVSWSPQFSCRPHVKNQPLVAVKAALVTYIAQKSSSSQTGNKLRAHF